MSRRIVVAAVLYLLALVLVGVAVWFWGVLVDYINPNDATARKDTVQVYAFIVAVVGGAIGATVGLINLYFSRMNLQHNREVLQRQGELEAERAQDAALQAYYEQMTNLLAEHGLSKSKVDDYKRLLAEAQTTTVLRQIDPHRKAQVILFLDRASLIAKDEALVNLANADLRHVKLRGQTLLEPDFNYADLSDADLRRADLSEAYLEGTILIGADLQGAELMYAYMGGADLTSANLKNANLTGTDLTGATGVTNEDLERQARSLKDATMPDGSQHP